MGDGDQQLTVLYDHYKDTFSIIRDREGDRDRLFLILVAVLGVLGVQIGYPADAGGVIDSATIGTVELTIGALPAAAVLTATWVIVFAISLRYAQRTIIVERQYDYLHVLEARIATRLGDAAVFEREGKAYLRDYPLFSDWVWISYVAVFPVVIVSAIVGAVTVEVIQLRYPAAHKLLDCAMASAAVTSTYLHRLHPPRRVLQRIARFGRHD